MKKDEDGDEKRIPCVVCAVGAGQCSGRLRRNNLTNKEGCELIKPSDRTFGVNRRQKVKEDEFKE